MNLDELRLLGASEDFLHAWEHGWNLEAMQAPVRFHKNHSSLVEHMDWAEEEWGRLEKLSKVRFLPDSSKPARLNVSPCALLLRSSIFYTWYEENVRVAVPSPVNHATVDLNEA